MTRVEVEDMQVANVDLRQLGHMIFKLPLIALQLGHGSLEKSDVYMHPTTLEARYACDVLAMVRGEMSTDEFCEEWFGGTEGGLLMLKRLWERGKQPDSPA